MTEKDVVRTTCPRDCYDSCGIAVVRRDGRIAKVLGDPAHPIARGALCGKCAIAYNGVWRDPEARLTQPLLRDGPKGSGAFRPIAWDEALDRTAERLRAIVDGDGPERILHAHYTGTCSLLAGEFPMRFFHRLGATEVMPDSICNNAGHVGLETLLGSSTTPFDPRSAKDSHTILVWGANPSHSAPHAHKHWLAESGAKVVVVDPVRHETAAAADLHLQPFPGSDAALAFALLHVLERDGAFDPAFIAAHCQGFEELAPLIAPCTPDWGAAATGVPAEAIVEAARLYAAGPAILWLGQGLQRQAKGGNVMRTCGLLPALTGKLGQAGSGLYYLNGGAGLGIDGDDVAAPQLRRTPPAVISHMDLPARLADPRASQAFFCWNMNVAASGPRQDELRRALAREDLFSVVADLFLTDTARYADLVLPAASFLEFDDLVTPYFHRALSAQVKAEDPPGEALPNQEIFRRLARAMGYEETALYERDGEILDRVLGASAAGCSFAALRERGTWWPEGPPAVQFADLRFPTPSGRIEIASEAAAALGGDRLPQPHADPRPPAGRLRLLSPAGRWLMNDSYGNDPKIQDKLGAASIAVHPEDAADLGLIPGQPARVWNEIGALVLEVATSDDLPRGVALSHKGRWPGLEADGCSVNCLNPGDKTDLGESSAVHGVIVQLAALA